MPTRHDTLQQQNQAEGYRTRDRLALATTQIVYVLKPQSYRMSTLEEQPTEYTIDDLGKLLDLLFSAYSKWFKIGIQLGLPVASLIIIESNHKESVQRCFIEMIITRLKERPLALSEICTALRTPLVGEAGLANRIERTTTNRVTSQLPNITQSNVLHHIVPDISDSFPYTHFKKVYPNSTLVLFILFLLLQIFSLLDDSIFRPRSFPHEEYVNRVVFFILRIVLLIVAPSVCYWQFHYLATLEKKLSPQNNRQQKLKLSKEVKQEVDKIRKERRILNPFILLQGQPFQALTGNEVIHYQALIHALLFPLILFCLDIFYAAHTYQPIGSTESWRQRLTIKDIQIIEVWDCIAITITLFLSGVLRDVYCFENHLATVLTENISHHELDVSRKIFDAVRQRWFLVDFCLEWVSVLFAVLTFLVIYNGEPFIPKNSMLNDFEQNVCNILTVLLAVLQAGGSSASPFFKLFSIVSYFAIPLILIISLYTSGLIYNIDLGRNGLNFHLAPGNISLLLYTVQAVSYLNWLLCLYHSIWRQNDLRTWQYHSCLGAVVLIALSLCSITIWECFTLVD